MTLPQDLKIDFTPFKRYLEPLLGNGETLRLLSPTIPTFLNDLNAETVEFYRGLHQVHIRKELDLLADNWDRLKRFIDLSASEIFMVYLDFLRGIITSEDISFMLRAIIMVNMEQEEYNDLIGNSFVVSFDMLLNSWALNIEKELVHMKSEKAFAKLTEPDASFNQYIESALKQGLFAHLKNLTSLQNTDLIDCLENNKSLATQFFLKQYSKEKQLAYDSRGNLRLHYDAQAGLKLDFKKEFMPFFKEEFKAFINPKALYNQLPETFLQYMRPDKEDLIVFNLLHRVQEGKGIMDNFSLKEIDGLLQQKLNYLLLTNEQHVADHFIQEYHFMGVETTKGILLKNF